ncbi:unnamed protein product, partial [Symbiodinium sp. CCMP2592]
CHRAFLTRRPAVHGQGRAAPCSLGSGRRSRSKDLPRGACRGSHRGSDREGDPSFSSPAPNLDAG